MRDYFTEENNRITQYSTVFFLSLSIPNHAVPYFPYTVALSNENMTESVQCHFCARNASDRVLPLVKYTQQNFTHSLFEKLTVIDGESKTAYTSTSPILLCISLSPSITWLISPTTFSLCLQNQVALRFPSVAANYCFHHKAWKVLHFSSPCHLQLGKRFFPKRGIFTSRSNSAILQIIQSMLS